MKANKLVMWFWNGPVKKKDAKRVAAQPVPEHVDAFTDIEYLNDNNPYHKYDIFRPEGVKGKLPVIFDIHGGGWYYGDKELNQYFCKALTYEGFAVVSISYRLVPETDFFGQMQDVFAAMKHLQGVADEYGLDLDNFFVAGDSAGGHITGEVLNIVKNEHLQKAYGVEPSIIIKGACMICPAAEPLEMAGEKLRKSAVMKAYFNPVFGKGYIKNGVADLTSFKETLQKDIAPVFFISAYADMLKTETKAAYELVKANGIKTGLCFFDKPMVEGHKCDHVFNVLHWEWEEAKTANKAMCDFFKSI
ncbi:MAG: alpha/beta hydrolase [Clostridia bacterium]|nr:alpha/beta hydrolase [Clostridia bacterium]